MPIYIYQCPNCGYKSEELVLDKKEMTDKKDCPKCGKAKLKKQPTSASTKSGACDSCSGTCDTCGL